MTKRITAACVAAAMSAALGAIGIASANSAQAQVSAQSPAPNIPAAAITWEACGDLQCGSLEVPLDYSDPAAGTVTLALTRRVHTAKPYRGILLGNPGGPGASGTFIPVLADYVPYGVGEHFDWIGFDPRGVGRSTPALTCDPTYFGPDRPNYVPTKKYLRSYWVTKSVRYAQRCGQSDAASLLGHVSTRESVQDLESIRQALQADADPADRVLLEKINYIGYSYGSYLGQVYAVTHPQRVGRFVLDGIVDPGSYWYRSNLQQSVAFDRNLNRFFQWMAANPTTVGLGTDWVAIRRGYQAQLIRLDKKPSAGGNLGPSELADAMLGAAYYVYDWVGTATAYANLVRNRQGWELYQRFKDANGGGNDNGYAMYLATQCTDAPTPSWATQFRDARRIHRDWPFLAWNNTWYNAPCNAWPVKPTSRIAVPGSTVTVPMLLINETYDAATPFGGALNVRDRFPGARLIEGVGGTTHSGSLSGISCVDNRIASFLKNGTVPKRLSGRRADVGCPAVPAPLADEARTTAAGLPADVRAKLLAAQAGAQR